MQTSKDILDAVAKKLGGATDYRIGKETGIRQGTISNIRNGKCSLSAEGCAACADILGVEAGALIAIATAERQDDPDIRKSLLRVARKGMAAAALTAAIGLSAAPLPPAHASSAPQQPGQCLLCKVTRTRDRRTRFSPGRRPERRQALGDRRGAVREYFPIQPGDTRESSPIVTRRKSRASSASPTLIPA